MPGASLRHPKESFDSLFRRYKKAVEKDDLLRTLREREAYEKPSTIRNRAKSAARKRAERQAQEIRAEQDVRARLHVKSSKRVRRKTRRKDYDEQENS